MEATDPLFPFRGFTIGDCFIPRAFLGFGAAAFLLLGFLEGIIELAGAE